jgi:PPP family 3-phenylpropionic acid transporter
MNAASAAPVAGRTLAASALLSFAYFVSIGLISPYAPLWYKELGLPVFALGVLASIQSWTRLFAPYAWGLMADRSGRRVELIRLGALACLISGCGFLLPPGFALLAGVAFLMFSFNAAIVPLTETVVAAQLAQGGGGMDARRYGRVRVWGSVGFLAAVLVGGWWFEHFGMRHFVPLMLGALVLLVLAAWWLPVQAPAAHEHAEPAPPVLQVLARPEVRWFFAGLFLTVLAHSALYAFFSLYLDSLGHAKRVVGLLWAVSVLVEIAWFWLQGRALERGSLHQWLTVAALISSGRFAMTAAFGDKVWLLVLAQCSHALTFAAQHTACIALVTRYFPGRLRGRGQALYSVLGYGCSGVLGALGGAWLAEHWGYASVYWAASVAALAGAWCCRRSGKFDCLRTAP